MRNRDRLLTALVGGGFAFETSVLLTKLADDFTITYLHTPDGGQPGVAGVPAGRAYAVPMSATVTRPERWRSLIAFAATFVIACRVILRERIDVIAVIGCSHAVPMLIAGRMLGRRTVFVESITRTERLSQTGRIVLSARLAERFVVQWPSLCDTYPRVELGSVL